RERHSAQLAVVRALGVLHALVLPQRRRRLELHVALLATERLVRRVRIAVLHQVIPPPETDSICLSSPPTTNANANRKVFGQSGQTKTSRSTAGGRWTRR